MYYKVTNKIQIYNPIAEYYWSIVIIRDWLKIFTFYEYKMFLKQNQIRYMFLKQKRK